MNKSSLQKKVMRPITERIATTALDTPPMPRSNITASHAHVKIHRINKHDKICVLTCCLKTSSTIKYLFAYDMPFPAYILLCIIFRAWLNQASQPRHKIVNAPFNSSGSTYTKPSFSSVRCTLPKLPQNLAFLCH